MSKLPLILLSSALLAACGTAASSSGPSSQARSTTFSIVRLNAGVAVGSDSASASNDLGRTNVTIRKGSATPIAPLPAGTSSNLQTGQSPAMIMDRCSVGFGTGPRSRSATQGGKRPPLPMCVPQ